MGRVNTVFVHFIQILYFFSKKVPHNASSIASLKENVWPEKNIAQNIFRYKNAFWCSDLSVIWFEKKTYKNISILEEMHSKDCFDNTASKGRVNPQITKRKRRCGWGSKYIKMIISGFLLSPFYTLNLKWPQEHSKAPRVLIISLCIWSLYSTDLLAFSNKNKTCPIRQLCANSPLFPSFFYQLYTPIMIFQTHCIRLTKNLSAKEPLIFYSLNENV